jgi:3-oxo-5alpha-steroid 4-dehydrogenase
VQFGSKVYTGKISYPPAGYDLYYSGNEATYPNSEVATPAPRGHRVVGKNFTGFELTEAMRNSATKLGVRFQSHTRIDRLVVDSTGRVIGVEASRLQPGTPVFDQHEKIIKKMKTLQRTIEGYAKKHYEKALKLEQEYGIKVYIRARKGVIITTGSNAFNRKMVEAHAPRYAGYMYNGTISCDGSGIGLGQSVGAAV